MNLVERLARGVRHAPLLRNVAPLWGSVRPTYDALLEVLWGRTGLERRVNELPIQISPRHRNVPEEYEPATWRAALDQVRPGDAIVEVGAHIGLYTIAFARRVGPAGTVMAFEPEPANLAALRLHLRMNAVEDRVVAVGAAVSDRPGLIGFASGRGSESRIARGHDRSVTVPAVTLDAALEGRRVDGLKVDVEGAELLVLRGARALLADPSRRPRWLLVEVHPFAWEAFETTSDLLVAELARHGYDARGLDDRIVERITGYGWVLARRSGFSG